MNEMHPTPPCPPVRRDARRRARRRRAVQRRLARSVAAVLVVAGSTAATGPVGAASGATLDVAQGITSDGTPGFESGAPAPDQPGGAGNDASDRNGVVRTFDDVTSWVDWSVNDAAADVTVSVAASAGTNWQALPPSCLPDSVLDGVILTCHLGTRPPGSTGRIAPVLHVGGLRNLDTVTVTSTVSAPGSTPVTSTPSTVVVSAAPKFDLFGQRTVGGAFEQVPYAISATDPGGLPGRVFYYPVTVEVGGTGRGGEPATGSDFSFEMDVSRLPASAKLVTGGGYGFTGSVPSATMNEWACGPAGLSVPGVVYGRPGIAPAATTLTSTENSGRWSCSQWGTTISVSVTGATLSPASTPLYSGNSTRIATDRQILVSGEVGVWVSDADLQAISGVPGNALLQPTVLSWVKAPVGVSGAPNTGEDPTTDETWVSYRYDLSGSGDAHYVNGDLTWLRADLGAGPFRILNPGFQHPVIPWFRPFVPTQTQQDNVGDGTVVAGQRVGFRVVADTSSAGDEYLATCALIPAGQHLSTWDVARVADFEPVGSQMALINMTAPIVTDVRPGDLPGFDAHSVVNMNHGTDAGIEPNPAALANGEYRVEYSAASDPSCGVGPWTSTPPADLATVQRVRAFSTVPLGPSSSLELVIPLTIDAAPSGARVEAAGISTVVERSVGPFDATWFDDPSMWPRPLELPDHAAGECDVYGNGPDLTRNDCLWVVSSILGLSKRVTSPRTNGLSAGDLVRYELTATANGNDGGEVTDFTITDDLPAGLEYLGDATPAPTTTAPTTAGGHLVWNLGTVANGTTRSITYTARVTADGFTPNTFLFNQASLHGDANGSPLRPATAQALVVTGGPYQRLDITKSTDTPLIDLDADDGSYELRYENTGGSLLGDLDLIDVLPWEGDGRSPATDATGTHGLDSVEVTSGEALTVEYTSVTPASVNRDPADASNLDGGTTTWCAEGDLGTAGCPTDLGEVTGVRFHRDGPLAPGAVGTIAIGLATEGNRPGDVYTNSFSARIDGITLLVRSADVPITVRGIDPDSTTTTTTPTSVPDHGPTTTVAARPPAPATLDAELGRRRSGTVAGADVGGLAFTGGSSRGALLVAQASIVLGLCLLTFARRRSRRRA